MAAQTSEKAFETHVEEVLLQKSGWHPGQGDFRGHPIEG